jgi:metal-responsive CopG/Arc/MetJ family transcriptional regulator
MPRPKRNRRLISVYLAESGVEALDRLAEQYNVSRSDLIRDALKAGLPAVERKLAKS